MNEFILGSINSLSPSPPYWSLPFKAFAIVEEIDGVEVRFEGPSIDDVLQLLAKYRELNSNTPA